MPEKPKQGWLEKGFENGLWASRFVVMLAVIFGLLSAIILFIIASIDVVKVTSLVVTTYFHGAHAANFHAQVLSTLIGAIDFYLIGVVLLIFAFGLYELFISRVDVAKMQKTSNVLEIDSLDELKDKITKVIIMVLVVSFFQRVLEMSYSTPLEMLYLAVSIFALSLGLYFLYKRNTPKKDL